jgi:hypothetical protein
LEPAPAGGLRGFGSPITSTASHVTWQTPVKPSHIAVAHTARLTEGAASGHLLKNRFTHLGLDEFPDESSTCNKKIQRDKTVNFERTTLLTGTSGLKVTVSGKLYDVIKIILQIT